MVNKQEDADQLRNTWQPIETAPRDGTSFLTYGLGHGNGVFCFDSNSKRTPMQAIARWGWFDGERDVEVGPGLYRKEPCRLSEGWRTEFGYSPTHWMPLPEPPTSGSE